VKNRRTKAPTRLRTRPDSVQALQQRVAELTAENETLRKQVAELRSQLGH
jgi:cell division protein FtsB